MGKLKKPTRLSPQKSHNKYGIRNWLKNKLSINKHEDQDTYIKMFCEKKQFIPKGPKEQMIQRETFVSNCFTEFATWAHNYKKFTSSNSKSKTEIFQ